MANKALPPMLQGKFGTGISKVLSVIIVSCAAISTLMMFVYVLMRYFLNINFQGFEEIILVFVFWLYYMGAAFGSFESSHIVADLAESFIKNERTKRVLGLFVDVVKVCVMCALVYLAYDYVAWSLKMGSHTPVYKLPSVVTQGALLLGFVIMLFFDICYMIDHFTKFFSKKAVSTQTE